MCISNKSYLFFFFIKTNKEKSNKNTEAMLE